MPKAKITTNNERLEWDGEHRIHVLELDCCAFCEISGIQHVNDPFTTLVDLAVNCAGLASVVLFTTTNNHLAGDELMRFIHKHGLGKVTFDDAAFNERTGNQVWLYKWAVDHRAWGKFADRIVNLWEKS